MRTRLIRGSLGIVLSFLLAAPSIGTDWSRWRGPSQNGTTTSQGPIASGPIASGPIASGPIGLELLWNLDLGAGYSGVSVAKGKVVAMFTDGVNDFVAAFEASTGREVWRTGLGTMYQGHDGGHDGPVSTPVIDQNTVIALGAHGKLIAVSLTDGRKIWSFSLVERFHAREPFWGFCSTPVVADDVVVVQAGAPGGRSLVAVDKKTGTLRWSRGAGQVEYRSPVVATLNRRRQLLVSTDAETTGVDASDGRVLWSLSFGSQNYNTPVVIGDDRMLLVARGGASLFRVSPEKTKPKRLWRTREFRSTYAMPSPFQDHLYGFTDRYLTCIDAKTGRRKWRSREPGGKGIIIVDGNLIALGANGDLVVAKASPLAYQEIARLNVSDADSYSYPSYSDGVIFLRNLKHLAAVRIIDTPTIAAAPALLSHKFGRFLQKLEAANDKTALIDEFMTAQGSFPIVEDDRLVHFLYRGGAEDVAIRGNMIAHREEDPLRRVSGTDLYYRTYPIEPGARWEYLFNLDFGDVGPDPRNKRRAPGDRRDARSVSEVVTSSWSRSGLLEPYTGDSPGRIETFRFKSKNGGSRNARIFLPHDYASRTDGSSLLIALEGEEWLARGALPNTLNHLSGEVELPVVALLDTVSFRELGGAATREFAYTLAKELIPELEKRYRLRLSASARILLGRRAAAVASVFTALTYPEVFGGCVAISYGRADTVRARSIHRKLLEISDDEKPRFYIGWNRYEIWRPQSFHVRTQSRELAEDLKRHGYRVVAEERLDGAGWTSWRVQAGDALKSLLHEK